MSGLKNQLTKRTTRWIIGAIAVVVAAVAIVGYGVWANQFLYMPREVRQKGLR